MQRKYKVTFLISIQFCHVENLVKIILFHVWKSIKIGRSAKAKTFLFTFLTQILFSSFRYQEFGSHSIVIKLTIVNHLCKTHLPDLPFLISLH